MCKVSSLVLNFFITGDVGQKLSWTQRISVAIGVAKGIQFLHGGIIPGLFSNHTKSTNILLDQNFMAKISSYNLPLLSNDQGFEAIEDAEESDRSRWYMLNLSFFLPFINKP